YRQANPRRPGIAPALGLRAKAMIASCRRPRERSNPMKRWKLVSWASIVALAAILVPIDAFSQDTLSISGTFRPADATPGIGDDLAQVLANGNDHGWTLTLYDVTVWHDHSYYEWAPEGGTAYTEVYNTRVSVTSVDLEFVGPDADILNEVVQPPGWAGLASGAFLELWNAYYFDPIDGMSPGSNTGWALRVMTAPGSLTAGGS